MCLRNLPPHPLTPSPTRGEGEQEQKLSFSRTWGVLRRVRYVSLTHRYLIGGALAIA